MVPGIDPRVDIAFKKVFGSQQTRDLTVALINAVLDPPPRQRLVDVELLNPYTQQMKLDDKLSILDIKARDQQGRVFNVEMQMVARTTLPQRLLYYWSRMYGEQLIQGDAYDRLCPAISLCFVNGRLFPRNPRYHRRFLLVDPNDLEVLTNQQEIHILELPNFARSLDELHEPLDFWMYFLNNGKELDADSLPGPLDRDDVRRAMEVLKMLSQDQLERELYEGRLKAKRDALTEERARRQAQEQMAAAQEQMAAAQEQMAAAQEQMAAAREREAEAREQLAAAQEQLSEFRDRIAESEQQRTEAEQRLAAAAEQQDEAVQQAVKPLLIRQIQLCERTLGREVSDAADLDRQDTETLRATAERLERQLAPPQ